MAEAQKPMAPVPASESGVGPVTLVLVSSIVSSCIAAAAVIAYLTYFPMWPSLPPPPVKVVDMVQVAASVAKMAKTPEEITQLLAESAKKIAAIKEQGTIVIDTRTVVSAPDSMILHPGDLIEGAKDVSGVPAINPTALGSPLTPQMSAQPEQPSAGGSSR